mmetsp:Transcript_76653/g.228471  ORF Transcript_76653/g.228471 Transcript_76653/m.228471 type:complete len:219 (+) Transcript_76653:49-705(+)
MDTESTSSEVNGEDLDGASDAGPASASGPVGRGRIRTKAAPSRAGAAAKRRAARGQRLAGGAGGAESRRGPPEQRSPEVPEGSAAPAPDTGEEEVDPGQRRRRRTGPVGRPKRRRVVIEEEEEQQPAPQAEGQPPPQAGDSRPASALVRVPGRQTPHAQAPLDKMILPGSADETWVRSHPLFVKIADRGYPLPFGEREILALKSYTPKQYGGDAEITF